MTPATRVLLATLVVGAADAFVVSPARCRRVARPASPARAPSMQQGESFDVSASQFDLLSLRSFRRDTILQYDATNQSEPLRIALCFLGILFSLCAPTLFEGSYDALSVNVGAILGTGISGTLFVRNSAARKARMGKIDLEYAMGDLRARYRGVRTSKLSELRGKRRVIALIGPREVVEERVSLARVYRRRLSAADAVVVPVVTDGDTGSGGSSRMSGEAESRWLWEAADPDAWLAYFDELLGARGMAASAGGAWLGLNLKGRSFGSALGAPRWDELLGTALQPSGDGFGDVKEVIRSMEEAAAEAAAEAATVAAATGSGGGGGAAVAAAEVAAGEVLAAQGEFYRALTSGDVPGMVALWEGAEVDESVSSAVEGGAKMEPWAVGSPSFPPAGMRPSDVDALIVSSNEAWTTAIERPPEGGTLLASQRWTREHDTAPWRIATHRYIPWDASGATAVTTLRCDVRGCCLLGRQINTREVSQRGVRARPSSSQTSQTSQRGVRARPSQTHPPPHALSAVCGRKDSF
jgi:hypothetical protein